MNFDHDTEHAVAATVALVNSDDRRSGVDRLTSVDQLDALLDQYNVSGLRWRTSAELRCVRALRSRLRSVFELVQHDRSDDAVSELNQLIAEAGALPQLIEHDGNPLHFHYTPLDAPLHDRLGADMAVALAIVVRDGGPDRLRICESPDCGRVLVDLSRNRSRRYCDIQCGNRQHVAAYRARQAAPER